MDLVGGWPNHLKYVSQLGWFFSNIWETSKNVPNHQPANASSKFNIRLCCFSIMFWWVPVRQPDISYIRILWFYDIHTCDILYMHKSQFCETYSETMWRHFHISTCRSNGPCHWKEVKGARMGGGWRALQFHWHQSNTDGIGQPRQWKTGRMWCHIIF